MSTILLENLYPTIEISLSKPENYKRYKTNLDKYMAVNSDKYICSGPVKRPIFSDIDIDVFLSICGLDRAIIKDALKKTTAIDSSWKIMNAPFNTAVTLSTRYFTIKKDTKMITVSTQYLIISMYPSIHYKYFKYEPNESLMNYTINNLSNKYIIKQYGNLWDALYHITSKAYELHKDGIIKGTDRDIILYIQDVKTRLNSFMKQISIEFYANNSNGKYLEVEHESFEKDNYYESDSNSFDVERITLQVVNYLCSNGADMEIVDLAANINKISVNKLRTALTIIVNESHRDDLVQIIGNILSLYLITNKDPHSVRDIGNDKFLVYCSQIYKKSNTTDKKILEIKNILNNWMEELDFRFESSNTENSFKRAIYMFFVITIMKLYKKG